MFKVNNKNPRKRCEVSPKLTKSISKKVHLQDLTNSDIHSSSYEERYFSDSDAEL